MRSEKIRAKRLWNCGGQAGRGLSPDALQRPVELPHEISHRLDLAGLPRRCRHQFLQQPLRVDPTQGMVADPELGRIVRDDHGVAEKTMMANGSPDAGFREHTDRLPVENVDTLAGQIFEERHLVAKASWFVATEFGRKRRIGATVVQIVEGGVVEDIVLIAASEQRQEV
ncbi:hypothetical protein [Ensifer sp. ENS12]|uniref:hypothetical protein n=1 Tax=Ensifer sp. ENS12 TaxID=2854774 RepID=UPI002106DE95|nr:hypothetical protein [Ensifer sp. ENS12]